MQDTNVERKDMSPDQVSTEIAEEQEQFSLKAIEEKPAEEPKEDEHKNEAFKAKMSRYWTSFKTDTQDIFAST